jgi:hypothetical protein
MSSGPASRGSGSSPVPAAGGAAPPRSSASPAWAMRRRPHACLRICRLIANAVGCSRETSAREVGPREEEGRSRLERPHRPRAQAAVEERDLAEDVAGTEPRVLELALARQPPARLHEAALEDVKAVRLLALAEEDVPGLQLDRRHHARDLLELVRGGAGEQGNAGQKRGPVVDEGLRHRGLRSARPRRRCGATRSGIEYSGASSHLDVSVVSGSDAISKDSGWSLAPICHSPSRSRYSSPSVYQRLT